MRWLILLCVFLHLKVQAQDQTIELCDGNKTYFNYTAIGTPGCSYTWKLYKESKLLNSFETETINVNFDKPGTYTLKAQIENPLCESNTETYTILVIPCRIPALFVPSSFTPNKDYLNDKFVVKGTNIEKYEIQIYTRWGSIAYTSTNINEDWDGTYNGALSPDGVYVYLIRYVDVFGHEDLEYGTITLYR